MLLRFAATGVDEVGGTCASILTAAWAAPRLQVDNHVHDAAAPADLPDSHRDRRGMILFWHMQRTHDSREGGIPTGR